LAVYLRAYELAGVKVGGIRAGNIAREIIGELAAMPCLRASLSLDDAVREFEASVIKRGSGRIRRKSSAKAADASQV